MTKNPILKVIILISLISGAIMGLIALIPFLSFAVLCILMFIIAPFIIIYFNNLNLIEELNIEKGILYGGISGFIAFIGFSITFFPIAFIIDLIFKTESFLWVSVIFKNFSFMLGMILFSALLSAILNMFTGFLTTYIYQYFKK